MPDISPLTNALLWSFAIIFGCWLVMQLLDATASFRENEPPETERTPSAERPSAGPGPQH